MSQGVNVDRVIQLYSTFHITGKGNVIVWLPHFLEWFINTRDVQRQKGTAQEVPSPPDRDPLCKRQFRKRRLFLLLPCRSLQLAQAHLRLRGSEDPRSPSRPVDDKEHLLPVSIRNSVPPQKPFPVDFEHYGRTILPMRYADI